MRLILKNTAKNDTLRGIKSIMPYEGDIMQKPTLIREVAGKNKHIVKGKVYYAKRGIYKCLCGKEFETDCTSVNRGYTKSCGCLRKGNLKHGHAIGSIRSKTLSAWCTLVFRCNNPNYHHYADYGGRGITVCKRWLKFENFLADMGEVPEGMQIDRINNELGYSKENCRWVTPKENSRNRRSNRIYTVNGKTACLAEHCEDAGLVYRLALGRVSRGWSIERALTEPSRRKAA